MMENILKILLAGLIFLSSCKRDDYYVDGGVANPVFNGTVLEYLDSHPQLDTIGQLVRLAGLEDNFTADELTFFSPSDVNIKMLIGRVNYQGTDPGWMGNRANQQLYNLGLDTIQTLADVDSAIWRKYLERYMFHGKHTLSDYPQIDFSVLNTFGGQNYYAYNNTVSNIGVVFHDAVTDEGKPTESRLKYMGYRQLYISYIPNVSIPENWIDTPVASSDIQPSNGVVHVLDFTKRGFGFDPQEVIDDIIQSKR
ncbi:hypothetical protein [Parapedobacter sp. 2B3]|uniref:hypothetical protein n=1 Tax=Parapedobacter sp. 2B3 TaxID=3342381 RepID=UPI0035B5CEEE